MATRTILGTKAQDGETFTYTATFLQEDGATPVDFTDAVGAGTDVVASLYRNDTKAAINSRNAQAVITTGASVQAQWAGSAAGVLTFKGIAADTTLAGSSDIIVVLRVNVSYQDAATVTRTGIHEVTFTVEPLDTVV